MNYLLATHNRVGYDPTLSEDEVMCPDIDALITDGPYLVSYASGGRP
jgi:hypothetical protein